MSWGQLRDPPAPLYLLPAACAACCAAVRCPPGCWLEAGAVQERFCTNICAEEKMLALCSSKQAGACSYRRENPKPGSKHVNGYRCVPLPCPGQVPAPKGHCRKGRKGKISGDFCLQLGKKLPSCSGAAGCRAVPKGGTRQLQLPAGEALGRAQERDLPAPLQGCLGCLLGSGGGRAVSRRGDPAFCIPQRLGDGRDASAAARGAELSAGAVPGRRARGLAGAAGGSGGARAASVKHPAGAGGESPVWSANPQGSLLG